MRMQRKSSYSKLDPQFLNRWSPRSFLSDPLDDEDIMTLFEAARWAPSCYNEQPWLFVYGRGDRLPAFQSVMVDANRRWADRAPLLIIVFARREFAERGTPNQWAQFDSGAAWFSLCLQAQKLGLACHAMGGFHSDKAYEVANVDPKQYTAMCVVAVGRQGPPENLEDDLRQKEETRSGRKSLDEIVHEGPLPG